MEDEEFDLSALISATSPLPLAPASSPVPEPTQAPPSIPQVEEPPVPKRKGKKRSARACVTCRKRKVRCDILLYGPSCSNCRHDEIVCIMALSRRQRIVKERAEKAMRERALRNGCESGDPQLNLEIEPSVTPRAETHTNCHIPLCPSPPKVGLDSVVTSGDSPPEYPQTQSHSASQSAATTPAASQASSVQSERNVHFDTVIQPAGLVQVLPEVFASFPPHLDACDLAYLRTRSALSVPSESLQIEILKAYIEFVDSAMPILDLEEFLNVVRYDDPSTAFEEEGQSLRWGGKKQVPLLLFQAVMFAGVGYVSLKVLKDEGFENRESALRTFFNRAELLYDFDTTTDRLVIVQSLLLMTLHPGYTMKTDKKAKDACHFLTIAISLAFSLGLNRNTTNKFDSRQKRLERRIWWMLFIRDRLLPLDPEFAFGGNLVRIKRIDCGIQILSLSDFDFYTGRGEIMDWDQDEIRRRKNARESVEKARLCWCSEDRLICNFSDPYERNPPPRRGEYVPARYVSLSGTEYPQNSRVEEQILTASSSASFPMPVFEESEWMISSPTISSVPEECSTPSTGKENTFVSDVHLEMDMDCESLLGDEYGMQGEDDDYLEYLAI